MAKLTGVIWDMDGVLVDTGECHYQSWQEVLTINEIPFDRPTFNRTFGMNNRGILEILLGARFNEEIYRVISEEKEAAFRRLIKGHVNLLPGVKPLLEAIYQAGIPQAIGSSGPPANIKAIVDSVQIRNYFQALVSAAEMPGKPDPAVFLSAAGQIGAAPAGCLVIEDGLSGVEAAHRAGMKCIAVTTTNPATALVAADIIVDRLDQLRLTDLYALVETIE
jgi:beta-phosphoglucomutase family hydrolase